ncbi:MAG: histidine phosphatase family protein [Patescibacteria group bacterium]
MKTKNKESIDKNFCTLYLVRHGETEWNAAHIVQGIKDSPLTQQGIRQVEATAKELKHVPFAAIFSSDSSRAEKTAEIIRLERELAIETTRELRERNFGKFEGKPSSEFKTAFLKMNERIADLSVEEQKKNKLASDIESDDELVSRFITKLREIAVAYPGQTVLVTSHGGPIRQFLMHTGYYKYGELPGDALLNAGYVKVLCDGVDFIIKEVKGIKK